MPFKHPSNTVWPKSQDVRAIPERAATPGTGNETLPWGLITLAEGVEPVVDIVAVHGLDGHREKSWTVDDVNWLRDLLPTDIPHARIMSWGYDVRTQSLSHIGRKYIYDYTSKRPIIFVAHNLGGIVLKSALIHAGLARKGALEEDIKLSTYGVLFMGTPHRDVAGVELAEIILRIASLFTITDGRVIRNIKQDSEWLQQQLQQYAQISQEFVTKFAYEVFPSPSYSGKITMVVPQALAVVPGATDEESIAIPADHSNMIKFAYRQDVGYKKVSQALLLMVKKAPDIIRARWDMQNRVEEVLANVTDDFTIPFTLSEVPEIQEFVGRNEELSEMSEAFRRSGSERKVVVLQGLGGIGKTQLAVAYLKKHSNTYSAIFWLNGMTEDTLKQSFAATAKRLYQEQRRSTLIKTATETEDLDEIVTSIKRWLSIPGNHRWMLVFDNIDSPKIPGNKDPQAYNISCYFPEASHGSIIITTRTSSLRIGRVLYVRKLESSQECLAILASMSGRPTLDKDPHAAKLAKLLDGLPLALATAGAYLNQGSTSVEEYLRYYKGSWLKLQRTSPELISYEDRTLHTTWNLSFEHIQAQSESAAQLLRLWAIFDNRDVWYGLLAASRAKGPRWFSRIVDDEESFKFAMRILCDHALVEPLNHADGYGMHNCVHAWTQHVLNDIDRVQMGRIALSCVSSSLPREENPEHSVIERRLLPHAARCLDIVISGGNSLDDDYEGYLDDVHNLGQLFQGHGKLKEAEAMYCWALKGKEKALGPDHPSTLETVNNLGVLFRDQGKLKDAEIMYQLALEGKEKALGPDHTSTLDTVNNLGLLYSDQGKLKEAEIMYQRALEGIENALGPDHTSTLDTVYNLGRLYSNQGRLREAEILYQVVSKGREDALGSNHLSTLDTFNRLRNIFKDDSKLKVAQARYRRTLDGRERALGKNHMPTLEKVRNLLTLYEDQDKLEQAETIQGGSDSGYEGSIQIKAAGHSDTGVDSGYARSESTGAPVHVVEFDEDGLHDECDIRSVISNKLEIYSQVGSRKTWQEVAGQRSLSTFMTEIDELRPLYEASLLRMEKHRFINNLRRLLKDFYLDLSLHASKNLERAAINLLRSRASRVAIAQHIAETSELVDGEVRVGTDQSLQETASQELDIEAWIAGNKGLAQVPQEPEIAKPVLDLTPNLTPDNDSDQDSDMLGDDEDVERDESIESMPNIAEVKGFLMRGSPLQNLKNRLLVFLMPAAQSSLTRVLMTIPKDQIWVSHENDFSLSNQIKGFIEDLTEVRWNWWPLRPRMQNLQKGQTRLHWRCHCNTHLWVEISDQDAESFLLLREYKSLISQTNHLCIPRKCTTQFRSPLKDWAVNFFQAAGSHSDPRRAHYASGISPSVPTENLSAANTNSIGDRDSEFTAQGTVLSHEQESRTDNPTPVMNHLMVLFGVQGWRRTLELPQIDARKHNDEDALFQQLREAYRQARGFLRYWFSVWQFSHCDFVKFQKIRARQVISLEKDLPPATEDIYEYHPKPPQVTYPPISSHEFKMAFASPCWNICPFFLFHECIEPPQGNFAVESIPKRKEPWEIEKNERDLAWGLQAQQSNIAFFKVFLYHAVPILLAVGFWVYWQRTHPSDLTTSTIPVALVISIIAMLWSSIGVIHALRHAPT